MAMGLLVIGGVVIAVSVTGCVGADRELRFLLLIVSHSLSINHLKHLKYLK